jgi:hypothetical protein
MKWEVIGLLMPGAQVAAPNLNLPGVTRRSVQNRTLSFPISRLLDATTRSTGIADVGNFVTAAHGRRRGCVTTVDHL